MENTLIKIDPSHYGLEEKKAQQIAEMFKPMLDKMVELENEYNQIKDMEITPETCEAAKALRLKYVKVRTGTAAIHKEMKAFYLAGGRFVDGWKNAQIMASQGIETRLKAIEEHYKRIEAEKIEKLRIKREAEVLKYSEVVPGNLGEMTPEVWDNYLFGVKAAHKARIEEAERIERERLAAIEAKRLEDERIRKENERLKKEAEERERLAAIERKKRAEQEAKERAERQRIEAERLKKEAEERAKHEAQLKKEREERQRIEAELKAKKEAEERAEAERLAAIEADAQKGDAEKMNDLKSELYAIKSKYEFKSKKNKDIFAQICRVIDNINFG